MLFQRKPKQCRNNIVISWHLCLIFLFLRSAERDGRRTFLRSSSNLGEILAEIAWVWPFFQGKGFPGPFGTQSPAFHGLAWVWGACKHVRTFAPSFP